MNDLEIFISGNVPSSKNGKRWTGKYLIHSKTTMRYIKESKSQYLENANLFRDYVKDIVSPYVVCFKFYRSSRRKFDYVNPLQTVQDLMVKYDWLEDDSSDHLIPVFETYEYNKEKPGVLITIKKIDNDKKKSGGTHYQRLLDYLKTYKKITSLEAIRDLGNTRLSATIFTLRKDGYNITSTDKKVSNRFGGTTTVSEYELRLHTSIPAEQNDGSIKNVEYYSANEVNHSIKGMLNKILGK